MFSAEPFYFAMASCSREGWPDGVRMSLRLLLVAGGAGDGGGRRGRGGVGCPPWKKLDCINMASSCVAGCEVDSAALCPGCGCVQGHTGRLRNVM